jgi:integrase
MVKIDTPEKRRVLDCAIQMARTTSKGALVPPGKTLSQTINRIYYLCKIFGITKNQLNITPHGLRHQFANDLYGEEAGFPSAVRGGTNIPDREADNKARHEVTRQLGHARTSITAAYTGARKQGRPRNNPAPDTRAAV